MHSHFGNTLLGIRVNGVFLSCSNRVRVRQNPCRATAAKTILNIVPIMHRRFFETTCLELVWDDFCRCWWRTRRGLYIGGVQNGQGEGLFRGGRRERRYFEGAECVVLDLGRRQVYGGRGLGDRRSLPLLFEKMVDTHHVTVYKTKGACANDWFDRFPLQLAQGWA